ncbi:MAG TPA: hypothetical protein VGO60_04380 [Iamia sp.]|jgi:hypothetical protein|nr:hypothetical protein [Iamia sp.]
MSGTDLWESLAEALGAPPLAGQAAPDPLLFGYGQDLLTKRLDDRLAASQPPSPAGNDTPTGAP